MSIHTPLSGRAIRKGFLDYFAERGHTIVPSMSLVPGGDPTLLFTNSGMVQFKDVFLGSGSRPYRRVADSQKCLRVAGKHNDLDDVGRDDSHHTFFEMLGNWSFGDYYKAEAIPWAWELLTEVWGLEKSRLWATCFEDEQGQIPRDDEAAEIWARQPGFDTSHLRFFGRKENFWEMADVGPCGPDSEIHIDLGPEFCDLSGVPGHVCQVNGECKRFLELWNLVFIQYNRSSPTDLKPLPSKHVDTGMGLDRVVSVLQGVDSNYKTDLFTPILDRIQQLAGHTAERRQDLLTPYRVIADHVRAATFLIADGVVPGNVGRNYVCRMIVRRASRFGSKAGFDEPFLGQVAETVLEEYGDVYPEILRNRPAVMTTLLDEERRFQRTVETGVSHLDEMIRAANAHGTRLLSGSQAFDLYATYGLPLEITRDIARESGLEVEEAAFRQAMETHRDASSAGAAWEADAGEVPQEVYQQVLAELQAGGSLPAQGVQVDPYAGFESEAPLLAIVGPGGGLAQAGPGDRVGLVLAAHNFYAESGGQVNDMGTIVSVREPRWEFEVQSVLRPVAGLSLLQGTVVHGQPRPGDLAIAAVNRERRWDIMRNHTATHLLHGALRSVLGEHARQAGSLVAPDRLRFDFTHPQAMTADEIRRVESMVQQAILNNFDVVSRVKPRQEAISEGAMALFGETYGESVRTISIGDEERVSYELCGGTHVPETGIIGSFLIVSEGSVAAGIRRIEALTGRAALELMHARMQSLDRLARLLGTSPEAVEARLQSLLGEVSTLERRLEALRLQQAESEALQLQPEQVKGVTLIRGTVGSAEADTLRSLIDRLRTQHPSSVIVLASAPDDRPVIVAAISPDWVARGLHAGNLVRQAAAIMGGGGGGKPGMAQAGGRDASKLTAALDQARDYIGEHVHPA